MVALTDKDKRGGVAGCCNLCHGAEDDLWLSACPARPVGNDYVASVVETVHALGPLKGDNPAFDPWQQ